MIRMPDCSFSAGIVFLSVSGGLFGISPAAKGKPHRLHTDTWIGLTSPHCLHFELVIERSEIPMLSNPTVELTRRRESKHPPPHQASCETRSRRSRPTICSVAPALTAERFGKSVCEHIIARDDLIASQRFSQKTF